VNSVSRLFIHPNLFFIRLIGQGSIPLNDVIRNGTIKRRNVQLSNPQGVLLEAVSLFHFFFSFNHLF
jgi:hypothetical protein